MNINLSTWTHSEFDALATMTADLGRAFARAGISINNPTSTDIPIYFWMNYADLGEHLHCGIHGDPAVFLMFYVDSPLLLEKSYLDQFEDIPGFVLILPHSQDTHWIRNACPWITIATIPWGCDMERLRQVAAHPPNTHYEVAFAGGFQTETEIRESWHRLTRPERNMIRDMWGYIEAFPYRSIAEVCDYFSLHSNYCINNWEYLRKLGLFLIPVKNHIQRRNLAAVLSSFNSVVYGNPSWQHVTTGSLTYGGNIPFSQIPAHLAHSHIAINLLPAQAQEGPSERLFEMAGAGCKVISEDSWEVRKLYKGCNDLDTFPIGSWDCLSRNITEALSTRTPNSSDFDTHAHTLSHHSWDSRVPLFLEVIKRALTP